MLPIDVDVNQIQRNKLFQKFIQQEQEAQPKARISYKQDKSNDKLDESSIYQDFANFAKNSKNNSPYTNKQSCPQFQVINYQERPQATANNSNNSNELKDLQNKNIQLLQQNTQIQQQLLDLKNQNHKLSVDLEINKNEAMSQKRVIQEQLIEIEQLKRQIGDKRSSSLEKTRQFTIVQTQLIQSNQLVEKLISQIMNQEQQLSIYRQTQFNVPKMDFSNYGQPPQVQQQFQQQQIPQTQFQQIPQTQFQQIPQTQFQQVPQSQQIPQNNNYQLNERERHHAPPPVK
ncbi:hypothetical protein pb186bvf_003520 [Paramecium bursaria]